MGISDWDMLGNYLCVVASCRERLLLRSFRIPTAFVQPGQCKPICADVEAWRCIFLLQMLSYDVCEHTDIYRRAIQRLRVIHLRPGLYSELARPPHQCPLMNDIKDRWLRASFPLSHIIPYSRSSLRTGSRKEKHQPNQLLSTSCHRYASLLGTFWWPSVESET